MIHEDSIPPAKSQRLIRLVGGTVKAMQGGHEIFQRKRTIGEFEDMPASRSLDAAEKKLARRSGLRSPSTKTCRRTTTPARVASTAGAPHNAAPTKVAILNYADNKLNAGRGDVSANAEENSQPPIFCARAWFLSEGQRKPAI
jgi:hypothetical protein